MASATGSTMRGRFKAPPRPPWWPEGEPWPPPREANRQGRALNLRLTILVVLVIALVMVAWIVIWHATGGGKNWEPGFRDEEGPPPQALFLLGIIGLIVFLMIRRIRRIVAPLTDVVDATYRLAGGDYSVRVEPPNRRGEVTWMVEAFNAMAARLETNETQRRHLLADIAHELRTPLAVIQGNLEAMIDGVYPADAEHLTPLMDQSRTITRLLEDLQTVATAEAGMLTLHRVSSELDELARDAVSAFQPLSREKGVVLIAEADASISLDVDPIRIRQVLDNLITNALRHTDSGGSVTVSVRTWPEEVEISVRDTGRGMTQEDADRMFERFVKSSDSGGSGLGLTIARNLVEAHGGTIGAISASGKGTTVSLRLPSKPLSS